MKKWIILSCVVTCSAWSIEAQPVDFDLKVDSIFMSWNSPGHPGGAVGIMRGGRIIYAKGFGLASLEYQIPNDFATRFNVASVSKQFTAFGILLLQERGLLSLDDPLQKFIPEIPEFAHPVTIRQMLNHTSGLRSLHALLSMAGWRGDDSRTNQDLLRFMQDQQDLNFTPGDEYLYCNTGYILCAMIIERISGQSFRDWMEVNVFRPLNMNHTYVEDKYHRVNKNLANSYYFNQVDKNWYALVPYWGYTGSGNIHTNIPDLLKWMRNIEEPVVGSRKMIRKMLTPGILNNGDTLQYALGVRHSTYRGIHKYGHGGSIGGYRSGTASLTDLGYHIAVITNFNRAGIQGKINRIIEILSNLPPLQINSNSTTRNSLQPPDIPSPLAMELVGEYFSPELRTSYWIEGDHRQLFAFHPRHGKSEMKYLGKDRFDSNLPWGILHVQRSANQQIEGVKASNGRVRNLWFRKEK